MHGVRTIGTAVAGVVALAGCAATRAPQPTPAPVPAPAAVASPSGDALREEGTFTVTATVEQVDLQSRLVTLRGPKGGDVTVRVADSVQNLAQVKKGDEVVVSYLESIIVRVKKPGKATPIFVAAEEATRAAPGEKPAGAVAATATLVVTIDTIDRSKQAVTLRGPAGNRATVRVKDPTNLDKVRVGDRLEITVTEAIAVAVQPAPKK